MRLFNSKTRSVQEFAPLNPPNVTFYACGLTVYDFTHIGHLRTYVNNDILKRVLKLNGYNVNHVMNITDVGHLTGADGDESGEDKMEKGAKKQGKTVWEVAEFYTDYFLRSIKQLNITLPDTLCKATDHISEMIDLIKTLEEKGFTYETDEAIYFDISKFKNYGQLSGQKLEDKLQKAREEVHVDSDKKNPADFALWFKRVGRFTTHTMHWPFDSAQGKGDGFPGWHIECSAMSMKYLGETIDIHSGGIDHLPVHHENEIAQSEASTGKEFVKFWFHNAHLLVDGVKMSKSLNNFYTIDQIKEKGFNPLALRYLFLQTHYRQTMNFTLKSLQGAQNGLNNLYASILQLRKETDRAQLSEEKLEKINDYSQKFMTCCGDDLQMSQALAVVFEVIKSNIPSPDKLDLLYEFDEVLGLGLCEIEEQEIPDEIIKLAEKRHEAKKNNDFDTADTLRKVINERGYGVDDVTGGFTIKKT